MMARAAGQASLNAILAPALSPIPQMPNGNAMNTAWRRRWLRPHPRSGISWRHPRLRQCPYRKWQVADDVGRRGHREAAG